MIAAFCSRCDGVRRRNRRRDLVQRPRSPASGVVDRRDGCGHRHGDLEQRRRSRSASATRRSSRTRRPRRATARRRSSWVDGEPPAGLAGDRGTRPARSSTRPSSSRARAVIRRRRPIRLTFEAHPSKPARSTALRSMHRRRSTRTTTRRTPGSATDGRARRPGWIHRSTPRSANGVTTWTSHVPGCTNEALGSLSLERSRSARAVNGGSTTAVWRARSRRVLS